jgi:hypothetical protein
MTIAMWDFGLAVASWLRSAMFDVDSGVLELNSLSNLPFSRIAAIGALAAALAVTGCGRKGGLDPPPGAAVYEPTGAGPAPGPAVGPDSSAPAPAPAPLPPKRTPIDWLID